MKKRSSILLMTPFLILIFSTPVFSADSEQPAKSPIIKNMDDSSLKKILNRGSASEIQQINVFSPLVGEWYSTTYVWAEDDVTPTSTNGTISNKMILGDRFLSSSFAGSANVGGHDVPFSGTALIGYDNSKEAYSSVWADTLSTGIIVGQGQYDDKEKVIKETGRFTNPLSGTEEDFRSELRFTDAENYKRTVFAKDKNGKERKFIEIEYSRSGSFTPRAAEEQKPPQ